MINLFDLSTGMAGNKRRDGSLVRRSRSDVIKTSTDPIGIYRDDITITNIVKKNSTSKKGGTPMKMLIAHEMLKETESKRKQPSIVARLMGLDDALSVQQPDLCVKRNLQEENPRSKSAGALRGRRQQEDVYFDSPRSCEIHSCSHEKEYKDVYEVWQQSKATNHTRDHAPLKERVNQSQKERKMAVVHQNFMEAKRLAMDEKHLDSKEFQDALEVLSSNKDLFLKFLEEPNSLFLKHIKELHASTSPTKTKRIAILKPSTLEPKDDKQVKQKQYPPFTGKEWGNEKSQRGSDYSRQKAEVSPTRIVVLKPSPTKICDLKGTKTTTSISSPEFLRQVRRCQDFEAGQAVGSRKIAKDITRQMRESVTSNWRDESLLSSALSNGYVGDNSSFDRSDNEYIDLGNLSDTEIMTPTSRNSWDFNNRIGSPYSVSSFSRASCSPESSMVREAKKRLSERWASVTSTNISQDQIQVQKSSSTLGEMLAIAEVKKEEVSNVVFDVSTNRSGGEEELRSSPARLSTGSRKVADGGESSSGILPRSKSVPVTSSAYENIRLNKETLDSQSGSSKAPSEAAKPKSAKSSFKGKVSSFFWRSKKTNKQKNVPSPLVGANDRLNSESPESVLKESEDLSKSVHNNSDDLSKPVHRNSDDISESVHISSSHETLPVSSEDCSSQIAYPGSGSDGLRKGVLSAKVALSLEKPKTLENLIKDESSLGPSENFSGNQDQPSPVSVLDAPFEDNAHNNISPFETVNISHPQALSRSEPIQSVVRTLSWDDVQLETTSSHEEEQFVFVQDLLSSAGIDLERVNTVFNSWHSLESPLNPTLLSNIMDQKEEGAKGRERRSRQRLLFDCVNDSILDIGDIALRNAFSRARPFIESQRGYPAGTLVSAEVWGLVRARFASEANQVSHETDNNSMVDGLLRKDLAGKKWTEQMLMERGGVCQDIVGNISDELIAEALLDITDE